MDSFLREIQNDFLNEAEELLSDVESFFLILEKNPEDEDTLHKISRLAHNFKGSGKTVGFDHLASFCHEFENLLVAIRNKVVKSDPEVIQLLLTCCDRLKEDVAQLKIDSLTPLDHSELMNMIRFKIDNGSSDADTMAAPVAAPKAFTQPIFSNQNNGKTTTAASEEYIRLPIKKVEDLINAFGEQVILQSTLDLARNDLDANKDLVIKTIAQLSKLTYDLQQTTMSLRMVSLKNLFSRIERAVRDASSSLGKKIEFVTVGQDNELDKAVVEALIDPLTHMSRNAVDHGIEDEADRIIGEKNPVGKITMTAANQGGMFLLEIKDDGKGMDPAKIADKAIRSGLIKSAEGMSKKQIFDLIFQNGFSTKDQVSDISGRGVGMNVVLESIKKLRGTYEIESEVGHGTCFRIRVPLTLAVFNGMLMRVGEETFVTSASDVQEIVRASQCEINRKPGHKPVVRYKDKIFDLIDVAEQIGFTSSLDVNKKTILIAEFSGEKKAFLVDELIALQKVVHKQINTQQLRIPGASGATILGDGRVAIILSLRNFSKQDLDNHLELGA